MGTPDAGLGLKGICLNHSNLDCITVLVLWFCVKGQVEENQNSDGVRWTSPARAQGYRLGGPPRQASEPMIE
jgi:hypothetical protein